MTLRARREERGWSLEEVSATLRIPVPHLLAIEEGRLEDLPPGPYRAGHVRAYLAHLGLEPEPPPAPAPPPPPSRRALWPIRLAAGAVCLVLLALLGLQVGGEGGGEAPVAEANAPDQRVTLRARRTTRLRVLVDGEVVLDRKVPGGERIEVAGHHRVEVHLEGADAARVEYNGQPILPQGRQDTPRRLVFVDDLDPGS